MTAPVIGHRSEDFQVLHSGIIAKLQKVFQTQNEIYVLTSSGTGGMESAVANTVSPGDKVLTLVGGKFGERWTELCRAYGAEVIEENFEWEFLICLASIIKPAQVPNIGIPSAAIPFTGSNNPNSRISLPMVVLSPPGITRASNPASSPGLRTCLVSAPHLSNALWCSLKAPCKASTPTCIIFFSFGAFLTR